MLDECLGSEEDVKVLERLQITALKDLGEINLVVGLCLVILRPVEAPFFPVGEDTPLEVARRSLEIVLDLVRRVAI